MAEEPESALVVSDDVEAEPELPPKPHPLIFNAHDLRKELKELIPPLHRASALGDVDMVRKLLASKSSTVHDLDQARQTALLHAAGKPGNLEVVRELLHAGARVNAVDLWGGTALHASARCGDKDVCAELLKQRGALVSNRDVRKWTALHLAVALDRPEIVSMLLEAGADRNATNEKGYTAIALAKELKHIHIVEILVKQQRLDFDRQREEMTRRQSER